jgi:GTP-binding protein
MIVRSAVYLQSGLKESHFPKGEFPEIAFAGRSNVGKSSLINTLTQRKTLVRTSRNPGQTRTLNFFLINESLMMVDLPGYGYSKAPKEVIRQYQEAIYRYLKTRSNLVMVVLLLDIRRRPSEEDRAFLTGEGGLNLRTVIALTKADTISRGTWKRAWSDIAEDLGWTERPPVFFSSRTGQGREELWSEVEGALEAFRSLPAR